MNLLRRLRYNNRAFLTAIIFITALLPSIIVLLIYYRSERQSVFDQALTYEEHLCKDARADFQFLLEMLDQIKYEITNQFVSLGINRIDRSDLTQKDMEKIRIFEGQLQSIRRTASGVNNIYVIDIQKKNVVYSSTNVYLKNTLLQQPWMEEEYVSSQEWSIIGKHRMDYLTADANGSVSARCFSFLTGLVNKVPSGFFQYILQIDFNAAFLEEMGTHFAASEEDAAFVTLNGEILFQSSGEYENISEIVTSHEYNTDEYAILPWRDGFISHLSVPELKLEVYKVIHPFPAARFQRLISQIVPLVFIVALMSMILAAYIARSFTKPFEFLIQDTMRAVQDTSPMQEVAVPEKNRYIVTISDHFNTLIRQFNQLMKRSVEQEADKRKLQMRMLQAQINPHFLYNTLNSIKWMALMRREQDIAEAITSLVDLLDYSCKGTGSLVLLKDEVAFLKDYVEIQRLRNPDRNFTVIYELDDLLQYKIIKLSLQPALENAILHAFPPEIENPVVTLRGRADEEVVTIYIMDNGIGFDTSVITRNMTGIGIQNVDERIKLQFGPQYGLEVLSEIGHGTTVVISIPTIL